MNKLIATRICTNGDLKVLFFFFPIDPGRG